MKKIYDIYYLSEEEADGNESYEDCKEKNEKVIKKEIEDVIRKEK